MRMLQDITTSIERISSIIHNGPLASAIHGSVAHALDCPFVHLLGRETVWDVFTRSLHTAIRDIEEHPRGKLFLRLLEYGPHNPDHPEALTSDGKTTLSDPECGSCVEFVYSHMVNRFKGELAELLALEPCIALVGRLQEEGNLPLGVHLYWGDMIQERRRIHSAGGIGGVRWGGFTKGADGLLVQQLSSQQQAQCNSLRIHGIVEVKSMLRSRKRVLDQINRHIMRLEGGVRLGRREWPAETIDFAPPNTKEKDGALTRIMIIPSNWKLSREWCSVKNYRGRAILFAEPSEPPSDTQFERLEPDSWKITLASSQEVLNQAAYEMTFWYMSQVGAHIYKAKSLPKGWEYMTPEEAGYNAIKLMLYYIPLRHISKRQEDPAIKLYNIYCFGYPLGAESSEMLWPEHFPDKVDEQ